jgi:hypothetical protein
LALELERLQMALADCLSRCVNAYNQSEIMLERYTTFDELTARLGEGFLPTPAYKDILWKRHGVPGIRPVIIEMLSDIFTLAEERLVLSELLSPSGRDWKTKPRVEFNRDRFSISWHGDCVVLKALHW